MRRSLMVMASTRLVLCALALAGTPGLAQTPAPAPAPSAVPDRALLGAPSPDSLARLVMGRFVSGTADAFDSVYVDPLGRAVLEAAERRKETRTIGLTRVLWANADRAVLLLTGTLHSGKGKGLKTGSDETNAVRRFSGLYLATRSQGSWLLAHQIPLDSLNIIHAQNLHVALSPGRGSDFVDTLRVSVGGPYGLALRLNNATALASVRLDGRPARYAFGGGVLWVDARQQGPPRRSELELRYSIPDERAPDSAGVFKPNAAADTAPAYGSLDNSDVWHPFFGYDSPNDFASLSVTVTLPAAYRLTTTVPQTDTVQDGQRIVHGESQYPQFLLALIYDRDWHPMTSTLPGEAVRFETFLTPEFHFSHDSLATVAVRVYHVLVPRFGEPQLPTHYLAVVEDRVLGHSGFAVRMNNAVIAGDQATMLDEPVVGPSYGYAHEVAHAWTMNSTGFAANFLQEGWATYCEGLVLGDVYGAAAEHALWEKLRTAYITGLDRAGFLGGFEGRQSLLGNPDNGRIHYDKGSWILHELEYVLGDSVFNQAMRAFVARAGSGPNGYRELIADMSRAAGRDMTPFIMPWLTEKYIPDVDARVEGRRLIVTQAQPSADFDLPLEVELRTGTGPVRRAVHLTSRADTADLGELGPVSAVRVDPDHHFLLRRHWGERVRFTLRAPDAKTVELAGNVASKPIPATREGDVWAVTLPLTEGRYLWLWRVDGNPPSDDQVLAAAKTSGDPAARAGVRIVQPIERLAAADAR
ncbi:MAG TPA: M1 family aminopeptidase [Gemmatimonadales bacterium]|nr:M1 family aminopeptidase [Gemmatimonadales bacterium]